MITKDIKSKSISSTSLNASSEKGENRTSTVGTKGRTSASIRTERPNYRLRLL